MFWHACPTGNPESLLIARELPEDEPPPDPRTARLRALLGRIPEEESTVVALSLNGATQEAIGDALGIRQSTVSYRLQRATERLLWLAGRGSWFGPDDIQRDLAPVLERQVVRILAEWWATGSLMRATEAAGEISRYRARSKLLGAIGELREDCSVDPKYPVGFLALWQDGVALSRPEARR